MEAEVGESGRERADRKRERDNSLSSARFASLFLSFSPSSLPSPSRSLSETLFPPLYHILILLCFQMNKESNIYNYQWKRSREREREEWKGRGNSSKEEYEIKFNIKNSIQYYPLLKYHFIY